MRTAATVVGAILVVTLVYANVDRPRAWARGAWDAADHNRDGQLTRVEMQEFGLQKPHRNAERLMMHFDAADTNGDQVVDDAEIKSYGTNVGSKDPYEQYAPGVR
ncbi:MAG: hypothetical protein AAF497_00475 [Planctomycetota bacterium]